MTDIAIDRTAAQRKAKRRENLLAVGMTAPYVVIFVIFTLIPVVLGFVFSFMRYNPYLPDQNQFIGLQNYINIFNFSISTTRTFWSSFATMLLFSAVTVPIMIIIPLALAYLINMEPPGYKIYRALIYLPSVVSITIMGSIFCNMFSSGESGLVNAWLNTKIDWLGGKPWAGDTLRWVVMLIATIWWQTGSNFVIFSGALKNVPKTLLEACEMDGGRRWKRILYVTLPNIKSSVTIVLFNTLIGYLSLYGQPYTLCTVDNANIMVSPMMFIQTYLAGGVTYARLTGYLCAAAILFGIIVMAFGAVQRAAMADRRKKPHHTNACLRYHELRRVLDESERGESAIAPVAVQNVTAVGTIDKSAQREIAREQKRKAAGKRVLSKSERAARKEKIVSFVILVIVAVLFAFPLVYMIGASFKTDADSILHPERIFPSSGQWTFKHYSTFVINQGKLDQLPVWILNSLWSSVASVVLTVIMDLVVAFAVVFLKWKGKHAFVRFLILWMAVPGIIGTAPSLAMYVSVKQSLGIGNDIGGYFYAYFWLVVPGCTGIFNMLLMKNFFDSIPKDIVESAKSDGASMLCIFRRIIVPLAKSTVMLIILFSFVGAWNNLMWPQLIFAGEHPFWKTITVGLIEHTGSSTWSKVGDAMACSVFSMIPILIVFLITQNKMIEGLASTGIKA